LSSFVGKPLVFLALDPARPVWAERCIAPGSELVGLYSCRS